MEKKMSLFSMIMLGFFTALLTITIVSTSLGGWSGRGIISGNVWYREKIMPPPGLQVHVTLEDVSKMDVKSEVISETIFKPEGAPPWPYELDYDTTQIKDGHSYSLRARVEAEGKLIFISTQSIAPFEGAARGDVDIMVSSVAATKQAAKASMGAEASLENTYWKLTSIGGKPAQIGAGDKEINLILSAPDKLVKGYSGCNTFRGVYEVGEESLEFLKMASTNKACIKGAAQEQAFLSALTNTAAFRIGGENLSLYDASGRLLAEFVAR